MGSHTRKPEGGGGGRGRGSSGKSADSGNEPEKSKSNQDGRKSESYFRAASKSLNSALEANDFSQAAIIATHIAIVKPPAKEAIDLLLAGAAAFREGKENRWEQKPSDLAERAIRYAQEKTGYELPIEKQRLFNNILADSLSRTAEKYGRKSP